MKAVVDTSALISLARIAFLELIPMLRTDVIIPDEIYEEAVTKGEEKGFADATVIKRFLEKHQIQIAAVKTDSVTALEKTTGTFQTDLWGKGIPFTRSKYVHNMPVSIFNRFFRNLTEFLYLPNFYQTLFLANLYLILLGIIQTNKIQDKEILIFIYSVIGIFFIVVGASLHMGKNAAIYPLIPVFIFLAGQGTTNSRLPVYTGLLIFQLLLLGWR